MYDMRESNDINSLIKTIIIGAGIVTLVTMPIWLPYLLGKTVKEFEVGVQLTPSGISPYYKFLC